MLFTQITGRTALLIRLIGLALISWTVLSATHHGAGDHGRGLVISILLVLCVAAALTWMWRPDSGRGVTPELWVLASAGGLLCGAAPNSAGSAFVFVAVVAAGVRIELSRAFLIVGTGALALGVSVLLYNGSALGLLAYSLGFAAAALAGSNARQNAARAEQAELLLAQTQRSHEEQLRAAQLEESTRVAREIHDVLAHALAGLTIQLEATGALLERGADSAAIKARVDRAQELAREGLRETRRAVGALRGESIAVRPRLEALVEDYRAGDAVAELRIDGEPGALAAPLATTVVRVAQEALTNVRKHAPGAAVVITLDAGADLVLVIDDRPAAATAVSGAPSAPPSAGPSALAATGGGYGVQGMRERAESLGGTLTAGPYEDGWRVTLRVPASRAPQTASEGDGHGG